MQDTKDKEVIEHLWRTYLTTGEFEKERRQRRFFRVLPGTHRCKNCYAPFKGAGSPVAKYVYGKRPSNLNPQLCNFCEEFARHHIGGADVELSLLFADVRGSTTLAEGMSPMAFSRVIDRFYRESTKVMVNSDGLIDKIIGDQAAAIYVPGFAGPDHAKKAIAAARDILRVTGHGRSEEPWIPLGVGVHSGTAFVGALGSEHGTVDITVLGDAANTAARLSGSAKQGEILVSEAAQKAANMATKGLEKRSLELKGKREPVTVYVIAG